jgi:hypothetical protein
VGFSSKLFKCLFWVLIIVLLVTPMALICEISNREKREYEIPEPPVFVETAYGSIATAERMDIKESISVSGTFQSFAYDYIELKQNDPAQIRWSISVGDEIQKGQCL